MSPFPPPQATGEVVDSEEQIPFKTKALASTLGSPLASPTPPWKPRGSITSQLMPEGYQSKRRPLKHTNTSSWGLGRRTAVGELKAYIANYKVGNIVWLPTLKSYNTPIICTLHEKTDTHTLAPGALDHPSLIVAKRQERVDGHWEGRMNISVHQEATGGDAAPAETLARGNNVGFSIDQKQPLRTRGAKLVIARKAG